MLQVYQVIVPVPPVKVAVKSKVSLTFKVAVEGLTDKEVEPPPSSIYPPKEPLLTLAVPFLVFSACLLVEAYVPPQIKSTHDG